MATVTPDSKPLEDAPGDQSAAEGRHLEGSLPCGHPTHRRVCTESHLHLLLHFDLLAKFLGPQGWINIREPSASTLKRPIPLWAREVTCGYRGRDSEWAGDTKQEGIPPQLKMVETWLRIS